MKLQFETEPLEITAAEVNGTPTFHAIAYAGNPMRPTGWPKPEPVVLDISAMQIPAESIPVNVDHGQALAQQVGHGDASHQNNQVHVDGTFSVPGETTTTIVESAKLGRPWKASVEATITKAELIPKGKTTTVNGQTIRGPVYVAASDLHGLGIVSKGADSETKVDVFAKTKEPEAMATETKPDEQATEKPVNVDAAFGGVDIEAAKAEAVAEVKAAAKAEHAYVATIREKCADYPEIAAAAIGADEHWSVDKVDLEIERAKNKKLEELRASRGTGPAIHSESSEDITGDVYACRINKDAGVDEKSLVTDYGEKAMELTAKLPKNAGLQYMVFAFLRQHGKTYQPGTRFSREIWAEALHLDHAQRMNTNIEAGASFSTLTISGLLSDVLHKSVLAVRRGWPSVIEPLFQTVTHTDFLVHNTFRLESDDEMPEVPDGGEISHGTLAEEQYTNQVRMYAKMLDVSYQTIKNDTANALSDIGTLLGRDAMRAREKRALGLIIGGDGTFWVTTGNRINKLTATALDAAGLTAANTALRSMKTDGGSPIHQFPGILLTSVELEEQANNLVSRTTVVIQDSSGTVPAGSLEVADQFLGRARPATSPYLDTGAISGAVGTTWYLIADPNMSDDRAFQYAVLDDTPDPVAESTTTDFNTLGVSTRIIWGYGFGRQSQAGAVRVEAT